MDDDERAALRLAEWAHPSPMIDEPWAHVEFMAVLALPKELALLFHAPTRTCYAGFLNLKFPKSTVAWWR